MDFSDLITCPLARRCGVGGSGHSFFASFFFSPALPLFLWGHVLHGGDEMWCMYQNGGTHADWLICDIFAMIPPLRPRTLVEQIWRLFHFLYAVSSDFPCRATRLGRDLERFTLGQTGFWLDGRHLRLRCMYLAFFFPLYRACIDERRSSGPWKGHVCHGHVHQHKPGAFIRWLMRPIGRSRSMIGIGRNACNEFYATHVAWRSLGLLPHAVDVERAK